MPRLDTGRAVSFFSGSDTYLRLVKTFTDWIKRMPPRLSLSRSGWRTHLLVRCMCRDRHRVFAVPVHPFFLKLTRLFSSDLQARRTRARRCSSAQRGRWWTMSSCRTSSPSPARSCPATLSPRDWPPSAATTCSAACRACSVPRWQRYADTCFARCGIACAYACVRENGEHDFLVLFAFINKWHWSWW